MNKKFSTLIASVLLTGFCSVTTMAQHGSGGLALGAEIPYRTQSTVSDALDYYEWDNLPGVSVIESTKWYQLEVGEGKLAYLSDSQWGKNAENTEERGRYPSIPPIYGGGVLVQYRDYDTGELRLKVVQQDELTKGTVANQGKGSSAISSPSLNSSLWKIEVVDKTTGSYIYKFTNKETGYELSFNCDEAENLEKASDLPARPVVKGKSVGTVNKSDVNAWRWYTYDSTTSEFGGSKLYSFNHESERVLGLALAENNDIVLVDMPASVATGSGSSLTISKDYNILSFTVRNAGARVLNAADINSMIDADGSWANRDNSTLIAKFKEVNKNFANNDFFTTDYVALDTKDPKYMNTTKRKASEYAGYSIILKDSKSVVGKEKYFMVATDSTYESTVANTLHGGLVVYNNTFDGDLTEEGMTALKARYHWKVTYYATPDSLVFEPLNASLVADMDKVNEKPWAKTLLATAKPELYYNTVNEGVAHPAGGAAVYSNAPYNKFGHYPVALTLMNGATTIDKDLVLTVGKPSNKLVDTDGKWHRDGKGTYHASEKYGSPLLTAVPADMGLKIRFSHTYTYLQRASKADDVYFIQISVDPSKKTDYRKDGMYLVYNMEGRLMYDNPDDYQNYEQMPATQWVIERDTCHVNGGTPYVTITNREYGKELFYGQLYETGTGTGKYYIINHKDYNVKSGSDGMFDDMILSCGDTIKFTKLDSSIKADEYLGYKRFDHDNLKYETYAMKYLNAVTLGSTGTDNYLSINEDSKLLGINSTLWNDYEIDTLYVDTKFGYASEKAGAIQLKRTVYALKVRDNNLIDNQWRYVVVADDEKGNPYYQMAHLKDVDGKTIKLGTFYFKADQIADEETQETAYALVDATGWSTKANLYKEYWVNGLELVKGEGIISQAMLVSKNPDETSPYGKRLYAENGYKRVDVKDQTAKVSFMTLNNAPMDRVSAFVFTNDTRPLYGTLEEGTINIYRQRTVNEEDVEYLYEDANNDKGLSASQYVNGFHYLGITANNVKPATADLYVDPVLSSKERMPKYLFFLDKDSVADGRWCKTDTHGYFATEEEADEKDGTHHVFYNGYVSGCVLVNLNDSVAKYEGHNMLEQAKKYGFNSYTRLGFVEAIHMNVTEEEAEIADAAFGFKEGEYLFVFKGTTLAEVTGKSGVVDPKKLIAAIADGTVDQKTLTADHQNIAFSVRLTGDDTEDILLESAGLYETGSYGTFTDASWVQISNGVPVLAQKNTIGGGHSEIGDVTTLSQLVNQAEILNIGTVKDTPTSNVSIVATDVKVIAGNGTVTILNAAGKTVAISNILGQTVAKQQITSDNATIAAPKGIVVVAVEGETAVKAIVK